MNDLLPARSFDEQVARTIDARDRAAELRAWLLVALRTMDAEDHGRCRVVAALIRKRCPL